MNLHLGMNAPARKCFLAFAVSPEAIWSSNFRDFGGAIRRMATMSEGGRITREIVEAEIIRLRDKWAGEQSAQAIVTNAQSRRTKSSAPEAPTPALELLRPYLTAEERELLEPLELVQLAEVIRICASSRSMAEAGRRLFKPINDSEVGGGANYSDRMRKYLRRYHLDWETLTSMK